MEEPFNLEEISLDWKMISRLAKMERQSLDIWTNK